MVDKKITLELVGLDGNAFGLLGAFRRQARKEGWTKAEIDEVLNEATSGDYDHLLGVLSHHTVDPDGDEEDWEAAMDAMDNYHEKI